MFLWTVLVVAYAFIAGLFGSLDHHLRCTKCEYRDHWKGDPCGHCFASIFLAICWPAGIPLIIGIMCGSAVSFLSVESRSQRAIVKAEHRVKLARINAQEVRIMEEANGLGKRN